MPDATPDPDVVMSERNRDATPGDPAERAREFLEVHAPECCTVCADLCAVHTDVLDLDAKLRRAEALIADLSQGDAVVMENARLRTKLREAERQVEVRDGMLRKLYETWTSQGWHLGSFTPDEQATLAVVVSALTEEAPDGE